MTWKIGNSVTKQAHNSASINQPLSTNVSQPQHEYYFSNKSFVDKSAVIRLKNIKLAVLPNKSVVN